MKQKKNKQQIVRKAIEFKTGGFRPTNSISESWIGKVYLYKEDEEIPKDKNGNLMFPLFQLCLENIEIRPDILADTMVITVFIAEELPMDITANGNEWLLREYKKSDKLIIKELKNPDSGLKPFPLKPSKIKEDYPVWDGGGLTSEMENEILKLEDSGIIEGYQIQLKINMDANLEVIQAFVNRVFILAKTLNLYFKLHPTTKQI